MIRGLNVWYSMKNPEMLSRKMDENGTDFRMLHRKKQEQLLGLFLLALATTKPSFFFVTIFLLGYRTLQSPSRKPRNITVSNIIKDHHQRSSNTIEYHQNIYRKMVLKCQVEKTKKKKQSGNAWARATELCFVARDASQAEKQTNPGLFQVSRVA